MTKYLIALSIMVHGIDDPITVDDADVPGVASSVYAGIMAGQNLHFNNGTYEFIIPFHAIVAVQVTRSTATVYAPADELCVTE